MSLLQARLALLLTGAEGGEEQSITCADCDAETSTVEDLETHVAADHLFWVRFQCVLCPKVKFPSRKNGVDHFALKHPSASVQLTENIDFAKEKELVNSLYRTFRQHAGESAQSYEIETKFGTGKKAAAASQVVVGAEKTVAKVANDNKRLRPRSSLKMKFVDDEDEDLNNDDDDEKPVKSKKKRTSAQTCGACDREVGVNRRRHVLSHLNIEIYHCSLCKHKGRSWEQIRSHIRSCHPDAVDAKPITDDIRDIDVIHKQWIACFGSIPLQYER